VSTPPRLRCAIVGSGNIGTDLMSKVLRSPLLELAAVVGVDPDSEGLRRADHLGVPTSTDGADWVLGHRSLIDLVFEATSAQVHRANAPRYAAAALPAVDLTPARIGPAVVPPVNLGVHTDAININLITCGGQATVPIVHAVARVTAVPYAEIVSTVASRSAGPGTRQNIDEFTQTTSEALVSIGGASRGKAIIVLNPADPPILMRNTVFCALDDGFDPGEVTRSILDMVDEVARYVPGYRLKADPVFEYDGYVTPGGTVPARVVALLEVEGAGDFLPTFAGNLDIMTAAAARVGESIAAARVGS
jgi:acetaldehyde dehydrogenase